MQSPPNMQVLSASAARDLAEGCAAVEAEELIGKALQVAKSSWDPKRWPSKEGLLRALKGDS